MISWICNSRSHGQLIFFLNFNTLQHDVIVYGGNLYIEIKQPIDIQYTVRKKESLANANVSARPRMRDNNRTAWTGIGR